MAVGHERRGGLTRREFLVGTGAAVLLAACSGELSDEEAEPPRPEEGPPGRGPQPFEGAAARRDQPERQHLPFLSLFIAEMFPDAGGELQKPEGRIVVEVTNNGNAPAFQPIVELYAGYTEDELWRGGMRQLSPIYPHAVATFEVEWRWDRMPVPVVEGQRLQLAELFTAIGYDPILDPRPPWPFDPFGQPPHHRKVLNQAYWIQEFANA